MAQMYPVEPCWLGIDRGKTGIQCCRSNTVDMAQLHHAFNDAPEFPAFLDLVAPNVDMPGPPPIIHVCLKPLIGSL